MYREFKKGTFCASIIFGILALIAFLVYATGAVPFVYLVFNPDGGGGAIVLLVFMLLTVLPFLILQIVSLILSVIALNSADGGLYVFCGIKIIFGAVLLLAALAPWALFFLL